MAIRQRKKRKLGFRRADGKCGGFLNYFFFLSSQAAKSAKGASPIKCLLDIRT